MNGKELIGGILAGLLAFATMCGIAFGLFTAINQSLPPKDRIDLMQADPRPAQP